MAQLAREMERLVTYKHPKSPVAEAYRTLRTNLGFTFINEPCRSILFTSTNPQDGKSTTIANIAVTMAQAGNRVIIVDCDLRKPVIHKIFGLPNQQGLTNTMMQQLSLKEVVHKNVIDKLDVLTSGPIPPNPAEMLASERSKKLWNRLAEDYDYVLIDSPPVLAVADASILATQVDGVILVVRSAKTRIDLARKAQDQLLKANAHIIGSVLNQLNMESKDYQYYYYYSHESSKTRKQGRWGIFSLFR
jgi:protein-tyrosine kinase